jgi:2-polyprenyl-6-methoxyphenol hydroxylase-like FAD-dependent oxidoreductase
MSLRVPELALVAAFHDSFARPGSPDDTKHAYDRMVDRDRHTLSLHLDCIGIRCDLACPPTSRYFGSRSDNDTAKETPELPQWAGGVKGAHVQCHAVIIGAGIAGLATAVALRRAGWSVSVYERADAPSSGGTALGMWPEAMRALDAIGVGDDVRRNSALSRGATILDPSGEPVGRIPSTRSARLISRERLMCALLGAVPSRCIHWSHEWKSADLFPEADLVVGADGIHSAIRSRTWGASLERPLHTVAYRGVVDQRVESVTETWGRGALFGITPTGDGRTNWFACVRRSRLGEADVDHAQALGRLFSDWHSQVRGVLGQVGVHDIDRRELFDVSLPHPYVRGATVLVGDAAHAMAPNLGRGACESLIDAVALGRALSTGDTVREGLRRYDRVRRSSTRRIVAMARTLNGIATAEHGWRIRDGLLRLALRP